MPSEKPPRMVLAQGGTATGTLKSGANSRPDSGRRLPNSATKIPALHRFQDRILPTWMAMAADGWHAEATTGKPAQCSGNALVPAVV